MTYLSTERVMTPSDNRAAPIRFAKKKFHGNDRILIRQAASWITLPVDDIDAFIAGIDAALELSGTDMEPSR